MLQSWYHKTGPINGEHFAIIFVTQWVALATVSPAKNLTLLITALGSYNSKMACRIKLLRVDTFINKIAIVLNSLSLPPGLNSIKIFQKETM